MPAPSYTYTLTNSTTADATQVMQNFNDILNGISDSTKDVSINALTCAGTATLNGAVNLGNASTDDITITGSLASSLPIKTTNTYPIGSSTLLLSNIFSTVHTSASGSVSSPSFTIVGSTSTGMWSSATDTLDFSGGGNQALSITSGGHVCIGSTAIDATTFNVTRTDASANGCAYFQNGNGTASANNVIARFKFPNLNDTTSCMFLKFEDGDSSTIGSVSGASGTTVAFNTSSDSRLKTNISEYNGLDLVTKMNPIEYEFKKFPGRRLHGFIAQEIYEVLPEVVHRGTDGDEINGNPWAIDYGKLTSVLCKAIKELKKEIDDLKAKIAA